MSHNGMASINYLIQAFRYRRISVRLRLYVNTVSRSLTISDGINEMAVREYEHLK